MLAVISLGVSIPGAAMASHAPDASDIPHMVITTVCTVYSDYLGDPISTLGDALGLRIGEMSDCVINTQYYEKIEPMAIGGLVISMPNGAGHPSCVDTDMCFVPSSYIIKTGESVTWENNDIVQHTVTDSSSVQLFDSWVFPGTDFTYTFDTAGTYNYHCKVHPWAVGTITVSDSVAMTSADYMDAAPTDHMAMTSADSDLSIQRVHEYVELYKTNGVAAIDMINAIAQEADPNAAVAGFVIDTVDNTVVAHDTTPQFVGFPVAGLLAKAFIPLSDLLDMLMEEEGNIIPLSYPLPDPQGNILGYENGQFLYYDGYVFGARFTATDMERSQGVVGEVIRLYDRDPDGAFDTINAFMSTVEHYPFVLDVDAMVVANGANPDVVGMSSADITNSTFPYTSFATWEDGDNEWIEYEFVRPGETTLTAKISWIVMHDGYIFGSGYYP